MGYFTRRKALLGGQWTPTRLGGQALVWVDANDGGSIVLSSGSIASISNKGSAGGTFAQATATKRPALSSSGLNGMSYASFDGVDDVLVCPAVTIAPASSLWMLAVHRRTSFAYGGLLSTTNSGTSGFGLPYAGGNSRDWIANDIYAFGNGYETGRAPRTIVQTPPSATDTLWHAISVTLGSAPAAELDGDARTLRVSAGGAFPAYAGQLLIGALTQTTEFFAGGIAEVLIVADPTRDQIDRATGYVCHRWGLQALMPAGHPYRNRRP